MAKKYTLNAVVTVSAYTVVEANSEAEAIQKAMERSVEFHANSPYEEVVMSEWVVEDMDGEAQEIAVERVDEE